MHAAGASGVSPENPSALFGSSLSPQPMPAAEPLQASAQPQSAAGGSRSRSNAASWSAASWRPGSEVETSELFALRCVTETPQPFSAPAPLFTPGPEVLQRVAECPVLVVGAGGLGCELLKTLCLSGFRKISVLDMDTVSVSNLHRQFLFRDEHVGQPKALVAAEVLNKRFRHLGVQIEAHCCKLQEKPLAFFKGFGVVIGGLDCVETRRWLNGRMHELVELDENGAVVMERAPLLLDGGTEGLRGQMRLCIPGVTACYECGIGTLAPQASCMHSASFFSTKPGLYCGVCMRVTGLQNDVTHRRAHLHAGHLPALYNCIHTEATRALHSAVEGGGAMWFVSVAFAEYCLVVQWVKEHPNQQIDLDNPDHLSWLFEASKARAEKFGIEGVTYRLTTGVSKARNTATGPRATKMHWRENLFQLAVIGESDRREDGELENYVMYSGDAQTYMHTFALERNPDCLVCSRQQMKMQVESSWTLLRLLEELKKQAHLNKPSIRGQTDFIFIQNPPSLREQHEWKLDLSLKELVEKGFFKELEPVFVTDPSLASGIELCLSFSDPKVDG